MARASIRALIAIPLATALSIALCVGTACGGNASVTFPGESPDAAGQDGGQARGDTQHVACGDTTCGIPAQTCCVTKNATPPPDFLYACVDGTTCPISTTSDAAAEPVVGLQCTSNVNCPAGAVCCISEAMPGQPIVAACAAVCPPAPSAQLCDPSLAPGETGCPPSTPCSANNIGDWDLPPTFGTCGGVAK